MYNINTLLEINVLAFVNGSSERFVCFSFPIYKGLHYDLIKTTSVVCIYNRHQKRLTLSMTRTSRQLRFRKGMDSNHNATIGNHRFTSFIAAYQSSFLFCVLWDGNGFRVHISHSPFLDKAERKEDCYATRQLTYSHKPGRALDKTWTGIPIWHTKREQDGEELWEKIYRIEQIMAGKTAQRFYCSC